MSKQNCGFCASSVARQKSGRPAAFAARVPKAPRLDFCQRAPAPAREPQHSAAARVRRPPGRLEARFLPLAPKLTRSLEAPENSPLKGWSSKATVLCICSVELFLRNCSPAPEYTGRFFLGQSEGSGAFPRLLSAGK